MLSIEKEKEIRSLISKNPNDSNRSIGRLAAVSRVAVQRVRNTQAVVNELGMKKACEVRKMALSGLSMESISVGARVSEEQIKAVVYYFFLQPRAVGSPISLCPTCGSMMFSDDFKEAEKPQRKAASFQLPSISNKQAEALYRIVNDLCDLEQCHIITNPLFYYLAQRARSILKELK